MEYPYKSQVLERLGVRSWINAKNWSTVIGGDWIDDRVLDAMNEVAKTFVDMHELIANADRRIAGLSQTEEAHITTGAGAAIELAVAGCMAGDDYGAWMRLPNTGGIKNEVLIPRGHYIAYTPQWAAAGAKIVEYGQAGTLKSFKRDIEAAITERTCCLSYTVDIASDIPPVANLHKYTDMGADICCISGGKAIKGPNNTGMLLGKNRGTQIIRAIRDHSFPHPGWSPARYPISRSPSPF